MSKNREIDRELAGRLTVLREQPQRDPRNAARGRAQFMAQAEEMVEARKTSAVPVFRGVPRFDAEPVPEAVSGNGKVRHNRWMHALQTIFTPQKKERSPMFSAIGTVLLIVSLVLGGTGATVVAAQDSLPDQGLYEVKAWSEQVRAELTTNEQARLQLALDLADRRAEELQVMLRAGKTPPEAVQTRMRDEIDLALRLAAGQPDDEALAAVEQIRERLQEHEQAFLHLGPQADPKAEALLEQVRAMLRERLNLCDDGIDDPQLLRDQLRERDRLHQEDQDPVQDQDQTQNQDQDREQIHQDDPSQDQDQDREQIHQDDPSQDQSQDRDQEHQSDPESGNPDSGSGSDDSGSENGGGGKGGN